MFLMFSGSKKKEPRYVCQGQGLTPIENVGRDFVIRSTLPAKWAVHQPQQVKVSAHGIMPGKKSGNNPGLYPVKGWKPDLGTLTRSQY
jgi:hypothetical protein